MKNKDIARIIEDFAPIALSEDYDNCGFICGDPTTENTGVLITLDLSIEVVLEAIEKRCNLIIQHHPSIFLPIKKIDPQIKQHEFLIKCIKNDIAVYAAHTNIDNVKYGNNDYFIRKVLGAEPIYFKEDDLAAYVGKLNISTSLKELADNLRAELKDPTVYFLGAPQKTIFKVSVKVGAGGNVDNIQKSIEYQADVFISSEFKHSALRFAKDNNYAIISTSHFCGEKHFSLVIEDVLKRNFVEKTFVSQKCISLIYE